jgi:hypothetical protein
VRSRGAIEWDGSVPLAATGGALSMTHFVPRDAIVADPRGIQWLFPEPACDRILAEINRHSSTLVGAHQ